MSTKSLVPPQHPGRDDSPKVVRKWFSDILINLHGVPEEEALERTPKWKYGHGSELLYYDIITFRLMFGAEAGTLLFGHARK
jgi:hypothetical protein